MSWKFGEILCKGLVCGTPIIYKTQKSEKVLPWKQLLIDTSVLDFLVISISWKFHWNSCMGLVCGTPTSFHARRCRRHRRRPDGTGYDYNPSLGLKTDLNFLSKIGVSNQPDIKMGSSSVHPNHTGLCWNLNLDRRLGMTLSIPPRLFHMPLSIRPNSMELPL